MKKCPFFGVCGGCKFDFTASDYRDKKIALLDKLPITEEPFWTEPFSRRRADFAFADGKFGFYQHHSKKVVSIDYCPLLLPEINNILPKVSSLPWNSAGSCLITACDNGIDIAIMSPTPYFTTEFKNAVSLIDAIRITWNGKIIKQIKTPVINFGGVKVDYPSGAFLQPTVQSENYLREMVLDAVKGAKKVADLFCGLGNFTFALKADGFDIFGIGVKRDLFKKPLSAGMLGKYDCVVLDPPRAGAWAQCKELVKSNIKRIVYVSCNPDTFKKDCEILTGGGYEMSRLCPIDQFVGSSHWELFAVFQK